jgi:hypothetical protein
MNLERRTNKPASHEAILGRFGNDLDSVINDLDEEILQSGAGSVMSAPREYRIAKNITPEQLERVAGLPFEVLITEHNAGLTLLTGTTKAVTRGDEPHSQMRTLQEARFSLHNHPNKFLGVPSTGDIGESSKGVSEIDMVLGLDGLTLHKSRKWDDRTNSSISLSRAVSYLRGGEHAMEYDLKKGYADAWIPWSDPRIALVCEYLNGTGPWREHEERVLERDKQRYDN